MNAAKDKLQLLESPQTSNQVEEVLTQVVQIPLGEIRASYLQVRDFEREQHIEELAASIESLGILQPLLLRAAKSGDGYELIAGERRFRAARLLEMETVPALLLELDDDETLLAAIVENAQRENLNPIEEAQAYQRLAEEFNLTQREIAESVGKKRATISNALRLLQLDPFVRGLLANASLSAGHGRALLMLEDAAEQRRFARKAVAQSLSVHTLEKKISRYLSVEAADEEDEALQRRLLRQQEKVSECLGLEGVALRVDAEGKRRLNLVFDTEASWKRFMAKIRS